MLERKRSKPLDARLARWIVYPLRDTLVTPNHLTTLRLLIGIAAAALLARGDERAANLGALCFALSLFLDHADGELARLSDAKSRFGHRYDLLCDLLVNALLFVGIGIGLSRAGGGATAAALGWLVGVSVALAVIFHSALHDLPPEGKDETRADGGGYFDTEDLLYLFPLVVFYGGLQPFLLLAAVGAPLFALWVICRYLFRRR